MKRALVIIPTYDEKDNVQPMAETVFKVVPGIDILFVDGNSPDGTGRIVDEMARADPRVHALHQMKKEGLGRAYILGFTWALQNNFDYVFEMDCDFSHNPAELPNFLKAIETADLVLGSRYIGGIRITNWPLRRLLLSMGGARYVRLITGLPVEDPTGGFKCFRREVLAAIDLDRVRSNGYSFQIEMSHSAWMKGFRITEIPITFEDRRAGYSKMSSAIFREALWMVWKLWFRCGLRRSPPHKALAARAAADR
jgi:dolichol-phosphate mannosyltransferase